MAGSKIGREMTHPYIVWLPRGSYSGGEGSMAFRNKGNKQLKQDTVLLAEARNEWYTP